MSLGSRAMEFLYNGISYYFQVKFTLISLNTSIMEYSKDHQIRAGSKEAKELLKRSFGRSREPKTKKQDSLLVKAQRIFNAWIRRRDEGQPCINCGKYRKLQAGHFYPTSTHSWLRFDEDNTNGECLQCNFYNSQSHAFGYRVNLIKKIGQERFDALEKRASLKVTVHDAKFVYEEIIKQYK